MNTNYYLRAYNVNEAKEKAPELERLDSFVDLLIEAEDGNIVLKKDGKFIIRCKDYKISRLFFYKNWENAIHLSEYHIGDIVHFLISASDGYVLEYRILSSDK
jgi:hypothetical protein